MHNHSQRRYVGVIGYRGYAGAELVRILRRHPSVDVVLLEHKSEGVDRPAPIGTAALAKIPATVEAVRAEKLAAVFLGTPADVSMQLAGPLLEAGSKVIDLSAAFRLPDVSTWRRWYKEDHCAAPLLEEAVYGLPEFYRTDIAGSSLIANPGCYPTAANLALRPLLKASVVDENSDIICDAASGVSGAGRKPTLTTSFCEVTENFSAYGLLTHRHTAEILQHSNLRPERFLFTPHLLPVERGILETIYLRTKTITEASEILSLYRQAYADEPFIRLYEPGHLPDLRAVQHTNFCDIGFVFERETGRLVIVAAEDNLGKGAAGQAVQNMNILFGFEESESLL